jgi:PAS domain S-box-containing protein
MGDQSDEMVLTQNPDPVPAAAASGVFVIWLAFAILAVIMAAGAVLVRLMAGPRFDGLLILAACASAVLLALRIPRSRTPVPAVPVTVAPPVSDDLTNILQSAGPAVVAIGLDGRVTFANSAAERMMGCDEAELKSMFGIVEILAPGETARLVTEMQRLTGIKRQVGETPKDRMSAYLDIVRTLPPSQIPCFDAQLRRKDGTLVPVTLHMSAMRDATGSVGGLVAVAVDQTVTMRQEQDLRESQERYRDLFENSSEMMATLSPTGRFVYANPAWKRCFGVDQQALLVLESFDELFEPAVRAEIMALFRRALDGELIDRAPLCHHTDDGRMLLFELSLSQRRKAGKPLAVRCMLRDVTHQKSRENRLALQLTVSQIVSENALPEVVSMRILEALCITQGWDLGIKWKVNPKEDRLEFLSAWGTPGSEAEGLIHDSAGRTLSRDSELPGRVWEQGQPTWVMDLTTITSSPRVDFALRHKMKSGWAVPVRVGNSVLAVLEFYSSHKLREDGDSMAAVEVVATSLGQMLARSQERGRAEELYRQQQILLDSVADGICGVDSQGLVTFVNPAAARLLGASPASLTGKSVHELMHGSAPANRDCGDDCPLRQMTERHHASSGEENVFREDGRSFPAEYALTPIQDHGHFSGSVLSFRDISQRNALDRLKDEFISTVSHELRTPLTSIRGALGLLSSGMLGTISEKASNLLRIALTNSDRLVRLINDILDLERIQSGREPLSFRPVQLSDVVKQAIGDMQPLADSAGVRLLHDSTQVEIDADPYRLLQVLTNILSNAVKFSPPNSTVSIMLRPGATGVTLSVIDNGRGIPADKLEAIFGRFQQVDASDSRQKGGSGLGLAICRTIVLQHSGRIWAERNPVRGSTFRLFLPYHPVPVELQAGSPDEEPGRGTILVACTNADVRLQMSSMLARHGYRIVESATAEQTVTAAHNGAEAILLDTSLDGMNGWEVLPLLRRLEPEAHTPVVLLSLDADRSQSESSNGLQTELKGWTKKAVEEDGLLRALTDVMCGPGEKARVLIVEDDRELAGVICEIFARESISVRMAHTLEDAVDSCFTFRPHLLVLNLGMPDGDGFNVVDWLRQHESLARLPLVIYAGRNIPGTEHKHLMLGPTHFLSKARVQPQQLEALVLTMLRNPSQVEEVTQQA